MSEGGTSHPEQPAAAFERPFFTALQGRGAANPVLSWTAVAANHTKPFQCALCQLSSSTAKMLDILKTREGRGPTGRRHRSQISNKALETALRQMLQREDL
jgi:hypothetical protein